MPPMVNRAVHSHLGQTILLEWSEGCISSVGLVRICRAAKRDGNEIPMLLKLANLGSDSYSNVLTRFKTHILEKGGILDMITPLDGNQYSGCVLPSTIIKMLRSNPQRMRLRLGLDKANLRQFWTQLFSSEQGMEFKRLHPFLRNRTIADLEHCAPCRMHEDAAPCSKSKSINILSWSSMEGVGTELETKYRHQLCVP